MYAKFKAFIGADKDPNADKVLKIAAAIAAVIAILMVISLF